MPREKRQGKASTRYMHLHRTIWNDDKFPFVSDACQLVFFHVLTTTFGGQIGIFKASVEALAAEKRKETKRYRVAFNEGIKNGFFEYDEKHHVIFVPHYHKYNPPHNPSIVENWGLIFEEIPCCRLKQQYYDELRNLKVAFGDNYLESFNRTFDDPRLGLSGTSLGGSSHTSCHPSSGVSCMTPSVTDTVTDTVTVPVSETETATATETEEVREPRFADNPQNLVDLWNEMVAPLGLPRKLKLNDSVTQKIRDAFRYASTKQEWEEILSEYPRGAYLRNELPDYGTPNFEWLLSKGKNGVENYIGVQGGRYRDKNSNGLDELTRKNLAAAERSMAKYNLPAKARVAITEGITDGYTGDGHHNGTPRQAGGSASTDADDRDDRYLSGGSNGVYAGAGADGDRVGEAEYDPLPDDRGLEDPDRGE